MSEAVWFAMIRTGGREHAQVYHDVIPKSAERDIIYRQRLDVLSNWDRIKSYTLTELTVLYTQGALTDPTKNVLATEPVVVGFTDNELVEGEPMLQFFNFAHLQPDLQSISGEFYDLACKLVSLLPRNSERTVALRKLLESKDCAVRSRLYR